MVPVPTEDFDIDPPGGSFLQSLLNLAISVLVVCAAALIGSFLSATSAHARSPIADDRFGARSVRLDSNPCQAYERRGTIPIVVDPVSLPWTHAVVASP